MKVLSTDRELKILAEHILFNLNIIIFIIFMLLLLQMLGYYYVTY